MATGTSVRRHAHIDLSAIRSTASALASSLPGSTADLRADAYGHGLIPVASALTDAGVGGFLVSRVEDAAAIADAGLVGRVTVGRDGAVAGSAILGPALFGLDPARPSSPAMRLEGEIIAVKRVPADRGVSYGYTYRTARPTTLVLVALSEQLATAGTAGAFSVRTSAEAVQSFRDSAGVAGSTGPTEVYEVDAAGTPVWHLVTRTQTMYRAEPKTSVGAETVVP